MIDFMSRIADFLSLNAIQIQEKIDLTPLRDAARVSGEVREALPGFTIMLINGAINLGIAIAILIAGWSLSRCVGSWMRRGPKHARLLDDTLRPLLATVVRYTIMLITLIIVLGQFGIQTTSLIALIGAAGLAIGLALQGTLANVASGVMLLILRPFRVGDYVTVGSAATGGTVREISLFTTEMTTPDMQYMSIPNSQIFGNIITNFTREPTRRINIIVPIDYEDDIDKARGILLDIMRSDPRVLDAPAPLSEVDQLAAYSVNLIARCFVSTGEYWDVYFHLQKTIKARFAEAGIIIPFPQQTESTRKPRRISPPDTETRDIDAPQR